MVGKRRMRGSRQMQQGMTAPVQRNYLLVDGHSIIHAWKDLRLLHGVAKRRHLARLELMQRLRQFQDVTGEQVVLVFDGVGSKIAEEREPQGLQIIYADSATTADGVIERLVARYANRAEFCLRVATADGLVQETVAAFGASCISPEMLQSECQRAEEQLRKSLSKEQ